MLTAALPLDAWLAQAHDLPLTEICTEALLTAAPAVQDPLCTVVRGLLGQRLRDLRCLTRAATCDGCPRTAECDYAQVFEDQDTPRYWLQDVPAAPVSAGTRFTARLLLAPPVAPIAPYVDVALRDALYGIGAELSVSRLRTRRLFDLLPSHDAADGALWRLEARTPLVLRGDETASAELCPQAPWVGLLVRAGVRRLDALLRAFADREPPRVVFPSLEGMRVIDGGMSLWRASRFSHRQGRRMPLAGLVGAAVLSGAGPIAPLLRALTVASVGKATALGLGTLRLVPVPP